MISFKRHGLHHYDQLYTGVVIEASTRGQMLSVPCVVVRENGQMYERRLAYRLMKKRCGAKAKGLLFEDPPCLVAVDHPDFLPALANGVHTVYHDLMCSSSVCRLVKEVLADLGISFGNMLCHQYQSSKLCIFTCGGF